MDLTGEQRLQLILTKGPYSEAEIRAFPPGKDAEYIQAMGSRLDRLGPQKFAEDREGLRQEVEAQILNEAPDLIGTGMPWVPPDKRHPMSS